MLHHPESEWKAASPNQNLKWIIDYLKEYVPANLYPNDLAVFCGIFTQFFETPIEKFHSSALTPVMAQWSSRKAGIIQWFKTNVPTEPPAILENGSEDDKKIWKEMPAYFQNLLFALKRQEDAYLAEQKTLKKGCNCASKPKPPRFYVLEHRLALIRNFGSIMNQTIPDYFEWWKKVPTTFITITPTTATTATTATATTATATTATATTATAPATPATATATPATAATTPVIVNSNPIPQVSSTPTPSVPVPMVSNDPTVLVAPPIVG